jgi:hypothetical protein
MPAATGILPTPVGNPCPYRAGSRGRRRCDAAQLKLMGEMAGGELAGRDLA